MIICQKMLLKKYTILEKYGSDDVSGIIGLDSDTDGKSLEQSYRNDLKRSTLFDLYYKHGVTGDKKLVYRTELTKKYPYPLFKNEKYVGLPINIIS